MPALRSGRRAAYRGTSLQTLVQMVDNGLGITLVPQLAIDAGILRGTRVVARPLAGRHGLARHRARVAPRHGAPPGVRAARRNAKGSRCSASTSAPPRVQRSPRPHSPRRYWIASATCGGADRVDAREVGDGARELEDAVERARGEVELRDGALQQRLRRGVGDAVHVDLRARRASAFALPCRASARSRARLRRVRGPRRWTRPRVARAARPPARPAPRRACRCDRAAGRRACRDSARPDRACSGTCRCSAPR